MIIPIGMIILGAEVILNLVLDIYRPRKAGEDPRPAYDSRLLGLLAAPDRIAANIGEAVNYQFGVDVTGTWFYQLLAKQLLRLVGVGVIIAWLMTMFVVVEPHERGLILTNGKISSPIWSFHKSEGEQNDIGSGLHVKLPWPFATFETPVSYKRISGTQQEVRTTTGVRILQLASVGPDEKDGKPIIWTESHAKREKLSVVQPTHSLEESTNHDDDHGSHADLSLVIVEVPMHFVVKDVKLFDQLAAPGQREDLLQMIGRRVVSKFLGEWSIDNILSHDKAILPELRRQIDAEYAALNNGQGPGIEILFLGFQGAHPPVKVAPSFERVIAARQNRESMIEEAKKEEIAALTDVAGSVELAEQIVDQLTTLESLRSENAEESTIASAELEVQRLLESAGGEAGEKLLESGASRWTRHMTERGRAFLLQGQEQAYNASPSLYRSQNYFDALLDSMRESRVYLTPSSVESLHVRIDLLDKEVGSDVFAPEVGADMNQ